VRVGGGGLGGGGAGAAVQQPSCDAAGSGVHGWGGASPGAVTGGLQRQLLWLSPVLLLDGLRTAAVSILRGGWSRLWQLQQLVWLLCDQLQWDQAPQASGPNVHVVGRLGILPWSLHTAASCPSCLLPCSGLMSPT